MKVILKADLKGTGSAGELVNVSDGYAKNYLLPRGIAVEATAQALGELRNREAAKQHRLDEDKNKARETAVKLKGAVVHVSARAGQGGRLFGSVTTKEIASAIESQLGIELDRRKIVLDEDIKSCGSKEIEIRLYAGVTVKLTVDVAPEQV
ncbi:MAG: 50S ribosomal protein L9 [Clostridia bacterium]|nr:50S ribosomal protein L9 [Clostridia bacterium]